MSAVGLLPLQRARLCQLSDKGTRQFHCWRAFAAHCQMSELASPMEQRRRRRRVRFKETPKNLHLPFIGQMCAMPHSRYLLKRECVHVVGASVKEVLNWSTARGSDGRQVGLTVIQHELLQAI